MGTICGGRGHRFEITYLYNRSSDRGQSSYEEKIKPVKTTQ